jgi:zinc-ribbon domain
MGTPLTVACPQCQQSIKASDELVGKKVRCKGCAHVFVISAGPAEKTRPAGPAASPAKPAAAPAKPAASSAKPASGPAKPAKPAKAPDADDEGPDEYSFADHEETVPRCPHCANELEADAKICIHCGYSTVTRQRVETKKIIETTSGDQLAWLMPGLVAAFTVLLLLGMAVGYCFVLPDMLKGGSWDWLSYGGFQVWFVIMCLFGMFFAGRFAVQRLILHPTPPEKVRGG